MSKKINLVAQSHGQENEYRRTIFSIWSFYAHVSGQFKETKTLLYTDDPGFFAEYFSGLPVECVLLTREQLKRFRGKDNFIHRTKIALIEDAFHRSDGNLLYIDGDTFFTQDPETLLNILSEKVALMHLREYSFENLRDLPQPSGAPFHAVLNYLESTDFMLADTSKVTFSSSSYSWNAGVIGLHRAHAPILSDVYAVTDQLYAATRSHASEQYAFSLILNMRSEIVPSEKIIYHYWYRVKKNIVDNFLRRRIKDSWYRLSDRERKGQVFRWTSELPIIFEKHYLIMRDNAIQEFNRNAFLKAYIWTVRALIRNPFSSSFLKDVAYHTRRLLSSR